MYIILFYAYVTLWIFTYYIYFDSILQISWKLQYKNSLNLCIYLTFKYKYLTKFVLSIKTMGENYQTTFVNYLVSRTAMDTQPSVIFALKCAFFFFFFFLICFIFYQSLMIYRMNDKNQRTEVLVLYKKKLHNV